MEILIIYSDFSKKCNKFLTLLNDDPIIDSNKLNKLCIDSVDVRKIVQKHIKKVPTVMIKTDVEIELYEGSDAFDWLNTFSDTLYNQLSIAEEQKALEINARIEEEARLIADEKLKQLELQLQQATIASSQQTQKSSKNVKQQAKLIAQDRTTSLSFVDQQQPDTGAHVSQVKSVSDATSISEQVKNMEREREVEEREIKKRLQPPM